MEAVLTNEIDDCFYYISQRILSPKLQEWITEILFQFVTFYLFY